MSDLENMLDVENTNDQPVDAVAADAETTDSTPQEDATDQVEFVIEDEGDQETKPKSNFDDVQKRKAAFARAKQKERQAKKEAQELKLKLAQEQEEREKLAAEVARMSAGPKPTLEDCDWDQDEYDRRSAEWQAKQPKQVEKKEPQKLDDYEPDLDAQFNLSEGDQKLKSGGIKDVEEKVGELSETIQSKFGINPDQVFDSWAAIAEESGEDYSVSSARYMIARNPAVLDEIARCKTPLGVNRILKREASKLKVRSRQKLDTQPEPTIRNGGPIDNLERAVEKARDAWIADGTIANYNAYKAAQKAAKAK